MEGVEHDFRQQTSVEHPLADDGRVAGGTQSPEPVFSELDYGVWLAYREGDRYVMIRDGKWKMGLFRNPENPPEFANDDGPILHDLEAAPGERNNLAGNPGCDEIRKDLIRC